MSNLICTPSRSRLGSSKIPNFDDPSSGSKQCWCVFLRLLQVAVVVVVVHQPLPQTSPFLQVPLISSSNLLLFLLLPLKSQLIIHQTPLDPLLCSYARSWICCAPPCFTSVVVVVDVAVVVVLLCSASTSTQSQSGTQCCCKTFPSNTSNSLSPQIVPVPSTYSWLEKLCKPARLTISVYKQCQCQYMHSWSKPSLQSRNTLVRHNLQTIMSILVRTSLQASNFHSSSK